MNILRQFRDKRVIPLALVATLILGFVAILIILIHQLVSPKLPRSPWTADNPLIIGGWISPRIPEKSYTKLGNELKKELEQQFDGSIEIKVDGIDLNTNTGNNSIGSPLLKLTKEKIKNKKWDIAFLLTPLLAVVARENEYDFAARILPLVGRQLDYVLVSKKGSRIQKKEDLNSNTKIALGEVGSEAFFYLPVYDLYGKSLVADIGNNPRQIIKKVLSDKVDVGTIPSLFFETEPKLKDQLQIVIQGRALPWGGVYLSPKYKDYHEKLKNALLSVSENVKKGMNYTQGEELDYQYMLGVKKRAEKILECRSSELKRQPGDQQPFDFFCTEPSPTPPPLPSAPDEGIVGKLNGYDFSGNEIYFTLNVLRPPGSPIHKLVLPREVLSKDPGLSYEVPQLNQMCINTTVTPTFDDPPKLLIKAVGQLKVVKCP